MMKEFADSETGGPPGPIKQSDNESVRTEDFANKFSQLMLPESSAPGKGRLLGAAAGGPDAESVRTEDFAREFRKTMVPPAAGSGSARAQPLSFSKQQQAALSSPYRPLSPSRMPLGLSGASAAGFGSADAESVSLTADTEHRLLPRSQRPPVVAFDDSCISDTRSGGGGTVDSSIRAQVLRDRIGSLLHAPPSEANLDSADRRLQELLQLRQQRGGAGSSRNSSPPRVSSLMTSRQLSPTRRGGAGSRGGGRISPIREAQPRSLPGDEADEDVLLADDEFANEVHYQSRLIQRELELERRRRAAGGGSRERESSASPTRNKKESMDRKVLELDELNQQVRKTLQEKEKIVGELHYVQDCLRRHQAEVRLSEKLCRDNKSRAEDTKTELMLAQTKRDGTAKELEQLGEELNQKKAQLQRMEDTCRTRAKELQDFESIGVAKEEIENILAERDELYQLVRQNEDAEFQRYELEKRLNQTREEMQAQACMAQQKVVALEEELEASLTKIAETSEERNALKLRLGDVEDKLRLIGATCDELTDANRQLARAKEVAERERVEEVERLKLRMQGDLSHIQRRTEEEEAAYKRQIQQLKDNLENLQRDVDQREEVNCDFREQLMRLENQLALETETKNHLAQEAERQLERASAEADRRLEAAREDARRNAEETVERERAAWQAASAKELRECQDRLQRTVGHLESELRCRDEELKAAQELARSKEAALKTAEDEHRTEVREQIRAALRSEKEKWDREHAERWQRELGAVRGEAARTIESLQNESKKRGDAVKELEQELHKLASELEREREKSRTAQRDRVTAINRLKEVAKEEAAKEVRAVREQVEAAAASEIEQAQERLRYAEETLGALRSEFEETVKREAESTAALERAERALVNQANAECLRIAEVLGVTPRRVTLGGQGQSAGDLSHRSLSSPGHPITAALANLEACGEELLTYCAELRDESRKLHDSLAQESKERDEEVERLRHDLAEEKAAELQALRERLIQEHMQEISKLAKTQSESLEAAVKEKEAEVRELRSGMQKWKSETAERLAARLQDEFRREFDKKIRELRNTVRCKDQELQSFKKDLETMEQERTGAFSLAVGGGGSVGGLETSAKAMLQLQERVKALREENLNLRRQAMQGPGSGRAPTIQAQGMVETPRLKEASQLTGGSMTNLHQLQQKTSPDGGYVNHLESNLRALEDRVRRAERQNEQISKDRINAANRQAALMQQQQQQQAASARASSRSGGSFRPGVAPQARGSGSGR